MGLLPSSPLPANPLGNELGTKSRRTGGHVPHRTGNVDVGKGNLLGIYEVLQEQPGRDGSTEWRPVIGNVCDLRFQLALVGFHQWHPPGLFSRGLGDFFEFFC
jgi:hypothetical protein